MRTEVDLNLADSVRMHKTDGDLRVEVTLTHPAAGYAAMVALEDMSELPPRADGVLVTVAVNERAGAVIEAARRLIRAGVGVVDIAVS